MKPAADRIDLSSEVRELLEQHGIEGIPIGTLSAERLQQILKRIAAGEYERPEIRDEILRRLMADLEGTPPTD